MRPRVNLVQSSSGVDGSAVHAVVDDLRQGSCEIAAVDLGVEKYLTPHEQTHSGEVAGDNTE